MIDNLQNTLLAKSFSEEFDVPGGSVGVLADIHILGKRIELRDVIVYPVGSDHLAIGTMQVRDIYRQIENHCISLGFQELRITGDRLTGASAGRPVNLVRRIK